MLEQRLAIAAVIRIDRDPETGRCVLLVTADDDRRIDRRADRFGKRFHVGELALVGQHDRELVAAHACDGATSADPQAQPLADDREHGVTAHVPEGIVDLFEVVEIEKDHGELAIVAAARDLRDRLGQALDELNAVRETGKRIEIRQAVQPLVRAPPFDRISDAAR